MKGGGGDGWQGSKTGDEPLGKFKGQQAQSGESRVEERERVEGEDSVRGVIEEKSHEKLS